MNSELDILLEEYKKRFGKDFIGAPCGEPMCDEEVIEEIKEYLNSGKPSPYTEKDWKDID